MTAQTETSSPTPQQYPAPGWWYIPPGGTVADMLLDGALHDLSLRIGIIGRALSSVVDHDDVDIETLITQGRMLDDLSIDAEALSEAIGESRLELTRKNGHDLAAAPDPSALIDQLSIAYRSGRKLRTMLASMHDAVVALPRKHNKADLSWTWEAASDAAEDGYTALLNAAELLGKDEDDLVRWTDPAVQS